MTTECTAVTSVESLIEILTESQGRLADAVAQLDEAGVRRASAIDTLLSLVAEYVAYFGKTSQPLRVRVQTQQPDDAFVLSLGPDGGRLTAVDEGPTDATLTLSAEAFVRLIYGRLDIDHRPPVSSDGVELDTILTAFPGF